MEKRIFLKSARTKTVDSHNSIDSIGSIDCIDSIDSIESEDSTDSIDSIDFIDSIDSILVPHKRPPAFTPHTKSRADSTDGGKPHWQYHFFFVCGMARVCVCVSLWHFAREYYVCVLHIYTHYI